MNSIISPRGRILSRDQVRVSDAPVSLEIQKQCSSGSTDVRVETDPITGDLLAIHVRCSCGEVTVIDCHYDDETKVRR